MDANPQPELTIVEALPWLNMTLDYTDKLAALIPDGKLDWRPEDPSGKWMFSLGELALHCADARIMFARQMNGDESTEGYMSEGPNEKGVWPFKQYAGKQAVIDHLMSSRKELQPWMEKPYTAITEIPDGTRVSFEKQVAAMKERGMPVDDAVRRGPANIVRVLMALCVHEAGHRGTLQTLLRIQGINLPEEG